VTARTSRLLKSRNPHGVIKMRDLQTGEEAVVAFGHGPNGEPIV
jgi:hypothetical protein